MTNILIFGAGSMGTAFSYPCSDKNHSVTIIGTHLENNFIEEINSKKIHPTLQCGVPKNVKFLKFDKLGEEINNKLVTHMNTERTRFINELTRSHKVFLAQMLANLLCLIK